MGESRRRIRRGGDVLFLMESEKALQEVESVDEGFLHILPGGPKEGDVVRVGTVIGFLLGEGEAIPEDDWNSQAEARRPALDGGSSATLAESSPPVAAAFSAPAPCAAAPSVRRLGANLVLI
ncbi:MAG: hypothetical protein R3C19_13600 [Planctomycetaceae bacterium]